MLGLVQHALATAPTGAASKTGTGTFWLALGLLLGFVVAYVAPWWLKAAVIVFDLVALGWLARLLKFSGSTGALVIVAVVALLGGMFWGVMRGLRHLGNHEFLTRLGGIRGRGWWI
jgi:hypothetical protein